MKRNKIFLVIPIVVIALLFSITAFAQTGLSGSGWWSWIQVQRIGSNPGDATVDMTAYAAQGVVDPNSPWDCGSRTLSVFGAGDTFFSFWSTDPGGDNCADDGTFPSPFQGSSVLSADDGIVAVADTRNISYGSWAPGDTPHGRAASAYNGVGDPSTTLTFPVYKNNHVGEITSFFIQNAGPGPADITAVFRPCAENGQGSPCLDYPNVFTYTITGVEPNKMVIIDPTLARDSGDNPMQSGNYAFGGCVVTGTQPLAGVNQEYVISASPTMYIKAIKGAGESDIGTRLYAPTIKYQYPGGTSPTLPNQSKWSGIQLLNADTVTVTVNVTYTLNQRDGDPNHEDVGNQYFHGPDELPPGESLFYLIHDYLNPPTGTQPGDLLSAEIVADGNIVAQVNEEGTFMVTGDNDKDYAAYAPIPESKAATNIAIPLYREVYKDEFSGAVVQNTSSVSTTITATMYIVDSEHGGASKGQTLKIGSEIAPKGSIVLFMICQNYNGLWHDLGGDDLQMADICTGGTEPWLPGSGVNSSIILEFDQPIVAYANSELLWYVLSSAAGDGAGIDASSYEGFPFSSP